ncbi:MAG: IPT/TIG domain-containing protein [Bryobacteraceae bacterium]
MITSISPSTWQAGTSTPVTITGMGFGTNPGVTVSDNLVAFSVTSVDSVSNPNKITGTATVPANDSATSTIVAVKSNGYGQGFQGGAGQSQQGTGSVSIAPVPIAPRIMLDNVDVTSKSTTVAIGQKISLAATGLPAGLTLASQNWDLTGTTIGDYTVLPDSSKATTTPAATDKQTVVYYYTIQGSSTATYTAKAAGANGQTGSATTSFIVVTPTYKITPDHGTTTITGNQLQYSGPGMTLQAVVTPPQGFGPGSIQWVQLVPSSTLSLFKSLNHAPYQTCSGSGLDTKYPATTLSTFTDSPNLTLDPISNVEEQVDDSYNTYLLWKPNSDGIFVSIAHAVWSWAADVVSSGPGWSLKSQTAPGAVVTSTSIFPIWSTNVTSQSCH